MTSPSKLNIGCGRNAIAGWVNVDSVPLPGVDIVTDLERCATDRLPLEGESADEFLLSHVLEHIRHPLPLMQELWRIAMPEARMVIRVPFGASDDAYEDPTHVRQMFLQSFGYFSQPFYWRADYGYRGDWQPEQITLLVRREGHEALDAGRILERVMSLRNIVVEMIAELRCVKPAREPRKELQVAPRIHIQLT